MAERKYLISPVQIFCFVFLYLLSGMMMYAGGSAAAALFAALFCACACVIACVLCENFSSARGFYASAFGALGLPVRYISVVLTSYSLINTLFSFSAEAGAFYSVVASKPVLAACLFLAVFSVANGFSAPARFAEVCVFPLFFAVLVSLIGGEGEGLSFSLGRDLLFASFDIIGSVSVFFSLYLRCAWEKSEKMSAYAKNSSFHPSALAAGVCAAAAALVVYAFFCFAEGENIMFSFFLWFAELSRIFAHTLALCDLAGLPEVENGQGKARAMLGAAAVFAAVALCTGAFGEALKTLAAFANVVFPCAAFAFSMLWRRGAKKTNA